MLTVDKANITDENTVELCYNIYMYTEVGYNKMLFITS